MVAGEVGVIDIDDEQEAIAHEAAAVDEEAVPEAVRQGASTRRNATRQSDDDAEVYFIVQGR